MPLLVGALPVGIHVVERFEDASGGDLYPGEARAVAGAVESRRREFMTVRACAREALARLGVPPGPIPPTGQGPPWASRAPVWPTGIVGSMTHCAGYRAAAVAYRKQTSAIGIDAEPHERLPEGVDEVVLRADERRSAVALRDAIPEVAWDRVVFSAKEAIFKAWYPLTGEWLGFDQCRIEVNPGDGSFIAYLLIPVPAPAAAMASPLVGSWRVAESLLATWVVVPAP